MKRTNLFIIALTFFLFLNKAYSQECGTPTTGTNQTFTNSKGVFDDSPICVNVFFHIIRQSNGSGGFNSSNIDTIVDNLNEFYNPHNIYIHKQGVDFINNSTYYDLASNEFNGLISLNNVSNSINFYLVNSAPYAGRAQDILSKNLVVVNSYALSPTSPHELGHCLNLWHTHHGLGCGDTGGCAEAINGSNCSTCGDFVCDTPADPCVQGQFNSNCQYTGGGGYNPSVTNIMSYGSYCRDHFTQGQATRMRNALQGSSILQQVVSNNCNFADVTGAETLCNTSNVTYTIQNGGNSVTWQTSSNLQIISSNNTNIIVRPINSSVNGLAFIKAILPNQTIQKNIWIGKAKIWVELEDDMGGTSNWAHGYLRGVNSNLEEQNITYIHWEEISASNGGHMYASDNDIEIGGQGPNNYWTVNARVHVTNSCGVKQHDFVLTPPPCPPSDYKIELSGEDTYFLRPIPCDEIFKTQNESISEIRTISVFDLHGNEVLSLQNKNEINLKNLQSGIYIIKAVDNYGNIINKKVKK